MKDDTRSKLLEVGTALMFEKGYNHTGIQQIVKAAHVPKGSFYHFFDSKEAFGLEVIKTHVEGFQPFMDHYLFAENTPPLTRLQNFFNAGREYILSRECKGGCIVGNMAQELSDQEEAFRKALDNIMTGWQHRFKQCLDEAQDNGELGKDIDTATLAQFLLDSWEGALLRSKLSKSPAALNNFIEIIFKQVIC